MFKGTIVQIRTVQIGIIIQLQEILILGQESPELYRRTTIPSPITVHLHGITSHQVIRQLTHLRHQALTGVRHQAVGQQAAQVRRITTLRQELFIENRISILQDQKSFDIQMERNTSMSLPPIKLISSPA